MSIDLLAFLCTAKLQRFSPSGIARAPLPPLESSIVKILIAATVFSAVASLAQGQEATLADIDAYCATVFDSAEQTMTIRQRKIQTLPEALAYLDEHMAEGSEMKALLRDMAIQAFAISAFETPEMQQRAIDDFANQFAVQCYQQEAG